MSRPENYTTQQRNINGTDVTVTSYMLDGTWHCTIANVDPGANIARADGGSREDAVNAAIEKATRRIAPAAGTG